MFGYIVPCVPELKIRELELYRQYYCGLCRALKDRYGRTADLAYDAAFIHILGDGLTDDMTEPERVKCAVHPFRGVYARQTPASAYAADTNILMACAKAADDVRDAGSIQARFRDARLRTRRERARGVVPDMVRGMETCADAIHELEAVGCAMPDAAAEPYGVLFGTVLSDLDVVQSHILYDLGYNTGRWVYLIDAWDDMEEDAARGQYNVYNACMKDTDRTREALRDSARFSMHFTLAQAANALERLSLKKNRALLENIVRLGMFEQTNSVLAGKGRLHESVRSPRRI